VGQSRICRQLLYHLDEQSCTDPRSIRPAPENKPPPTLVSAVVASKRLVVGLPLLAQRRHKCDEAIIFPQAIQVGIFIKPWITRKAVIGGFLQPLDRLAAVVEQRISRRNVVSGVVKVSEASSDIIRTPDHCLRFFLLSCFGQ